MSDSQTNVASEHIGGSHADVPELREGTVVAMGIDTEHWRVVTRTFPGILNCCINVCKAFSKEKDESTAGSGFDLPTRNRMRAKEAWGIVWEVAMCVLRVFGLLIVLCNHGRHRSLSLAYELSAHTGCELVSIRHPDRPKSLRSIASVMDVFAPRLIRHIELFGGRPHPVVGIHVCVHDFDGEEWAVDNDPRAWCAPERYHDMHPGDILVEVGRTEGTTAGWSFGTLIRGGGAVPEGWYPPTAVVPMPRRYFRETRDLFSSLVMRTLP